MIINGIYDSFIITDAQGIKHDLFCSYTCFSVKDIEDFLWTQETVGLIDVFAIENLKYRGTFIREKISSELLHLLYQEVGTDTYGPVTLVALMRIIFSDGYNALEELKTKLKNIQLKLFSGKNVQLASEEILLISSQLSSAGTFDQDLLCAICRIFENSSECRFQDWAQRKYRECTVQVKALRFHNDISA